MSRPRRYGALVVGVLALAAFNLTFRIGRESLTEWDESLYANSALEMIQSGRWVATTSGGVLDYSNSKPPLNVWLIAVSLKTFGASLIVIRLASMLAAWLTVALVLVWGWRRFSPATGLFSALVLSTCFGFLYVHSGRTANPDAMLTLLLLLIVITLDAARQRPWLRAWLGPLLAGVFMLKGMAVAMPLLLVMAIERRRRMSAHDRWQPLVVALLAFAVPVGAWAVARWQVDGWMFFARLFFQDFVALSTSSLDNQGGSPFFYVNILQKHHYDWMIAAVAVAVLFPPASWASFRRSLAFWRSDDDLKVLMGWWIAIALIVPSLMQTKLPWYVNPLYPALAIGVGAALSYGFSRTGRPTHHWKLLVAMVLMAALVAEAKLVWYSYRYRALEHSVQGLLLVEADRIRGTRVYNTSWNHAEHFVLRALVQAEPGNVTTVEEFLARSAPGEFLVLPAGTVHPALEQVAMTGTYGLYGRARVHRFD
jgi:4-amino-4-deoxy-L-arabinose transferase-like glycosyltransferase